MFPLFAFVPFINVPFILFDTESLMIGSYRKLTPERDSDFEKNRSVKDGNVKEMTLSVANLHDDIKLDHLEKAAESEDFQSKRQSRGTLKYAWFCLKTFYTAPCSKFLFNLVSNMHFCPASVLFTPRISSKFPFCAQ